MTFLDPAASPVRRPRTSGLSSVGGNADDILPPVVAPAAASPQTAPPPRQQAPQPRAPLVRPPKTEYSDPIKSRLATLREQFPRYAEVDDDRLIDGIYRKSYAGKMDPQTFLAKVTEPDTRAEIVGQNIVEFGKGLPEGAVGIAGSAVKGAAGVATEAVSAHRTNTGNLLARAQQAQSLDPAAWQTLIGDIRSTRVPVEVGFELLGIAQRARSGEQIEPTRRLRNVIETEIRPVAETPVFRAGEKVQDFSQTILPPAPGYEDSIGRELGTGLGSTAAGIGLALIPYAGPLLAMGTFELAGAGEALDRAIAAGANEEQILEAARKGQIPGLTDSLPVEVLLDRIHVPLPAVGRFMQVVARIGVQAAVEGFQEGGQQFLQNVIASEVYDPAQNLTEGVVPSTGVGAGVGAIAEAVATPFRRRRGGGVPNREDLQEIVTDPRSLEEITAERQAQQAELATAVAEEAGVPPAGAKVTVTVPGTSERVTGTLVDTAEQDGDALVSVEDEDGRRFTFNASDASVSFAEGAGTQAEPLKATTAADVDTAIGQVEADPSPAQKEAGNYQKFHLRLHGLDISIENPRGSTRSGIDPDGSPWLVEMTAHYGYIKRTEGNDGDQVDVYIGQQPESTTVFVVDQIEPDTGAFDEHKIILGTADINGATALYDAHFNDDTGVARRGAVTPLDIGSFKQWLARSDSTEPLAYKPPAVSTVASVPRRSEIGPNGDALELARLNADAAAAAGDVATAERWTTIAERIAGGNDTDLIELVRQYPQASGTELVGLDERIDAIINSATQSAPDPAEAGRAASAPPVEEPPAFSPGPQAAAVADNLAAAQAFARKPDSKLQVQALAKALNVAPATSRALLERMAALGDIQKTKAGYRRKAQRKAPLDVLEFLSAQGGIKDQTGDLTAMDAHLYHRQAPFRRRLVNNEDGLTLDQARELLVENGFLSETAFEGGEAVTDTNDVLDLVDRALSGQRVTSQGDRALEEAREDQEATLENEEVLTRAREAILAAAADAGATLTDAEAGSMAEEAFNAGRAIDDVIDDFIERMALQSIEVYDQENDGTDDQAEQRTTVPESDQGAEDRSAGPAGARSEHIEGDQGEIAAGPRADGEVREAPRAPGEDTAARLEPVTKPGPVPTAETVAEFSRRTLGEGQPGEGEDVRTLTNDERVQIEADRIEEFLERHDFDDTFPPEIPIPGRPGAYAVLDEDGQPDLAQQRGLHEETRNELLGMLATIDRIDEALAQPRDERQDPASGKRPGSAKARQNLEERLANERARLREGYDDTIAAYADHFGELAADAFDQDTRRRHHETATAPVLPDSEATPSVGDQVRQFETPATEQTGQGEQTLIPGVAPVTERDRADARGEQPLRSDREQRPADDGRRFYDQHSVEIESPGVVGVEDQGQALESATRPPGPRGPAEASRTINVGDLLTGVKYEDGTPVNTGDFGPSPRGDVFKLASHADFDVETTPDFEARREAMEAAIRAFLRRVAPQLSGLEIVDGFIAPTGSLQSVGAASYSQLNDIIRVSLAASDPLKATRHEAIHHLNNIGVINDGEWSLLQERAQRQWRAQFDIENRYGDLYRGSFDDDIANRLMDEEAVADAYANWRDGALTVGARVKRVFEKIRQFWNRVRNMLRGRGFQTTDDVFARIERGEVGARSDNSSRGELTLLSLREEQEDGSVGSLEARQAAQQGFFQRGQLIDRAIRMPFDLFGGVNAQGEWNPGARLFKGARDVLVSNKLNADGRFGWLANPIEIARAGLIDRYGLSEEFTQRERERARDERSISLAGAEVLNTLKDQDITTEEAQILQAVLTGEAVPDERWSKVAAPIRRQIDQMGQEAVQLGLLSAESYERNRGAYVHRVYAKHEIEEDALSRWVNSALGRNRRKIIGDQFKGRGIFLEVKRARLMRDVPGFAEARRGLPQKSERFVVLERFDETGTLATLDAAPERPTDIVYWPAERDIPAKYEGYRNKGNWEVRQSRGNQVVLWRDYTKTERAQMGEILDARYTIGKTFMMMAHDLATGRFYKDIAENEDWSRSLTPDTKWVEASDYSALLARSDIVWVKVPDTNIADTGGKKKYGALAGRFVRSEIWRDLNEIDLMMRPSVWRKAMTQWKLNKTARSPVVHMNNIMSNLVFMDMADVRAQDLAAGIRAYVSQSSDYKDAFKAGAFGADIISQELRREVLDPILKDLQRDVAGGRNPVTAKFGVVGTLTDRLWEALGKADKTMVNAYRMEDEIFRMATYIRRREFGDTQAQAADFARKQFLDYDIHAPVINRARRTVLPFISYIYRAAPLIARAIATRPWKLGKYFLLAQMASMLAYMIEPGDEDEERRSMRDEESGYTWIGVPRMLRMPFRDQFGNPVFLDIRRWIPAGDIFDVNQGSSAIPLPAPLLFGGPLMLGAELVLNKQGFTGKEITNKLTDNWWDKTHKLGDWAWKSWMPSAAWVPGSWYWTKIERAVTGARDYAGRPLDIGTAVASSVGIKLKPQDTDLNFEFRAFEFDKVEREIKAQARRLGRDLDRGIISDRVFNRELNRLIEKIERLETKREETFAPPAERARPETPTLAQPRP